ncbi:MAG: GxxExxY protein [Candidatus Brennerbacteria bacterium]|nr:GxxExxY protein [Candidatus Brennerbacteria bacterium]
MRIKREYTNASVKKTDLFYPELSFKLIGAAFDVYNKLGWGYQENIYQKAYALTLNDLGIKFEKEKFVAITFNNKNIGRVFLDFVVENTIVVEMKIMPKLGYIHINQVVSYLKNVNLKLAILIYFLKDGVRYRRIINSN